MSSSITQEGKVQDMTSELSKGKWIELKLQDKKIKNSPTRRNNICYNLNPLITSLELNHFINDHFDQNLTFKQAQR